MMNRLTERLHNEQCSCVIATADGTVHTFHRRGIIDLFITLKNEPEVLHGAMVADKVVGKAAAALMTLGGVSRVYADVISTPAIALLRQHGIAVEYAAETDHIINRSGTGWCPMETLSRDCDEPEEIKNKVEQFLRGNATCSLDDRNDIPSGSTHYTALPMSGKHQSPQTIINKK